MTLLSPDQISKLSAKQQLACGEITVHKHVKGVMKTKQVTVPEWLFDLATRKDHVIFNTQTTLGENKTQIKKMSKAMFTGLLIQLRNDNR